VLRLKTRRGDLFRLQPSAGVACDPTAVSAERKRQEPSMSTSAPTRATHPAGAQQTFAGLPEGLAQQTRDFIRKPGHLLIDGEWVEASSGKTFETLNPATEESLGWVAHGAAEDIELAVAAARRCFDDERSDWRRMTPSERGKVIHRIGDLIEQHADELAVLETLDNGKPLTVAKAADVALAADLFHYMSGWATKIEGHTIPISGVTAPGSEWLAYTRKEPVGVVGQIIPWNFPLLMASWKLGPALAAGVTVVLKPAEQTPLSALRLGELMLEAGLPAGVVNIVTGFGDAGAALAAHDGVDKVAFTGSTEVGRLIVQAAVGNLKKVTLELGGKSPQVLYKDADMNVAIPGAANGIFFNQGQCCNAGSRLYIERDVYDEVVQGVADEAKKIKVGPGLEPDTQMGPLTSAEQRDKVLGYMSSGLDAGARAPAGGGPVGDRGYFVEPTVLTDTTPDMNVVREEIFGPVVCAIPFGSEDDDVIRSGNDTSFGLASGIWTRDINKAHRTAHRLRAGTVWINCYSVFDAAMPFGGYKESGWGREMGHNALDNYLETKSVVTQLA
jgi:phenylacetaldehyde dehydrogenase